MLRITEIRLNIDHDAAALEYAILKKLGIARAELLHFSIYKRSYDARKRADRAGILFVYIVDVSLANFDTVYKRFRNDKHVFPTPNMDYIFAVRAPNDFFAASGTTKTIALRPVIVGFGPCGIFAALLLAQMGLRPIVLERGKSMRNQTCSLARAALVRFLTASFTAR